MSLQLRMLGALSVSQGGRALQLPASRKVRALLAYLALAPRATPRHRLCSLLWDTACDPRGELRWALGKLRGVVGAKHIGTREDCVRDMADLARPAHTILLGAGIPICEHMTNLAALPPQGGRLHAVPIAWRGGATFPVRAYVQFTPLRE